MAWRVGELSDGEQTNVASDNSSSTGSSETIGNVQFLGPPLPLGNELYVIAAAVIREDHAAMGLLQRPVMRRIGTLSYGMYLLHFLVLDEVRRFGAHLGVTNAFVVFVATVVATMAVAQLSYTHFERAFLKRKHAWAR